MADELITKYEEAKLKKQDIRFIYDNRWFKMSEDLIYKINIIRENKFLQCYYYRKQYGEYIRDYHIFDISNVTIETENKKIFLFLSTSTFDMIYRISEGCITFDDIIKIKMKITI